MDVLEPNSNVPQPSMPVMHPKDSRIGADVLATPAPVGSSVLVKNRLSAVENKKFDAFSQLVCDVIRCMTVRCKRKCGGVKLPPLYVHS